MSACSHPTFVHGLCVKCGSQLKFLPPDVQQRVANSKLVVGSSGIAIHSSQEDTEQQLYSNTRDLYRRKKLALLIDLDQTLIHANPDQSFHSLSTSPEESILENSKSNPFFTQDRLRIKQDLHPIFMSPTEPHYVKLRPGARAFLEALAPYFDLFVYTMGIRKYADLIVQVLDPTQRLVKKVVARGENGTNYKDLDSLLPVDPKFVLLLDDLQHVWKQRNCVVHLQEFMYWAREPDADSNFTAAAARSNLPDNILYTVFRILLSIHNTFYNIPLCSIPIIDLVGYDEMVTTVIEHVVKKYPQPHGKKTAPELTQLRLYINNPLYKVLLYKNHNIIERSMEHFLLMKKYRETEPHINRHLVLDEHQKAENLSKSILNLSCDGCTAVNCKLFPSLIHNTIDINVEQKSIFVQYPTYTLLKHLRSLTFTQMSYDYDQYDLDMGIKRPLPRNFDCLHTLNSTIHSFEQYLKTNTKPLSLHAPVVKYRENSWECSNTANVNEINKNNQTQSNDQTAPIREEEFLLPRVDYPISTVLYQQENQIKTSLGSQAFHITPIHHPTTLVNHSDQDFNPSTHHQPPRAMKPLFCLYDLTLSPTRRQQKPHPSDQTTNQSTTSIQNHQSTDITTFLSQDFSDDRTLLEYPNASDINICGGDLTHRPKFPQSFLTNFKLPDRLNTTLPPHFNPNNDNTSPLPSPETLSTSTLRMLDQNYLQTLNFDWEELHQLSINPERPYPTHYIIKEFLGIIHGTSKDGIKQEQIWDEIQLYNRFVYEIWMNKAFIHSKTCPYLNPQNYTITDSHLGEVAPVENFDPINPTPKCESEPPTTVQNTTCHCTKLTHCGFAKYGFYTNCLALFDNNIISTLPQPIHIVHMNYIADSKSHWCRMPEGMYLSSLSTAFAIDSITKYSYIPWLQMPSLYTIKSNFNGLETYWCGNNNGDNNGDNNHDNDNFSTNSDPVEAELKTGSAFLLKNLQKKLNLLLKQIEIKTKKQSTDQPVTITNSHNPLNITTLTMSLFMSNRSIYDFVRFSKTSDSLLKALKEWKKQFNPVKPSNNSNTTANQIATPSTLDNQQQKPPIPLTPLPYLSYMVKTQRYRVKPNGAYDFLTSVNEIEAIKNDFFGFFDVPLVTNWVPDRARHEVRRQYLPLYYQFNTFGFSRSLGIICSTIFNDNNHIATTDDQDDQSSDFSDEDFTSSDDDDGDDDGGVPDTKNDIEEEDTIDNHKSNSVVVQHDPQLQSSHPLKRKLLHEPPYAGEGVSDEDGNDEDQKHKKMKPNQ
jgi:FCP1-like phosphatase family protein